MPRFGKLATFFGALALLAGPAFAQRPGGAGGSGGGGPLMLPRNKSVAQELKLTDDQTAKIKTAADAWREKFRDQFPSARELDAKERVAKMEELQKSAAADGKKTLADILKPEQAERLARIERQENPLFRPSTRRERMEKVRAARKDANDKATALLTDERKATWKDLIGSPFEIKREPRGGGNITE